MGNYIKITKDVLNQIDYENVIAIFLLKVERWENLMHSMQC